jgi:hypothetical protein
MPLYGFECFNGHEVTVEADGILAAIELVEESEHSTVKRGRCLDGFDNTAPPGIPEYVLRRTARPVITT